MFERRGGGPRWLVLVLTGAGVASAGCEVDRDRPAGLDFAIPETRVELLSPQREELVPADSVILATIRATGLLTVVDLIVRHGNGRDTISRDRTSLEEPEEAIELSLMVRIPELETGTILEFIAAAEDIVSERVSSEPVPVIVIDCQVFPASC